MVKYEQKYGHQKVPTEKATDLADEYRAALSERDKFRSNHADKHSLFKIIKDLVIATRDEFGGADTRSRVYRWLDIQSVADSLGGDVSHNPSDTFNDILFFDVEDYDEEGDSFYYTWMEDMEGGGDIYNRFVSFGRALVHRQRKVERKAQSLVSYLKFGDEDAIWDGKKSRVLDGESDEEVMYVYGHHLGTLDQDQRRRLRNALGEPLDQDQKEHLRELAHYFGLTNRKHGQQRSAVDLAEDFVKALDKMQYNEFYDDLIHGSGTNAGEGDILAELVKGRSHSSYTEQLKKLKGTLAGLHGSQVGKMFLAEQFEKQDFGYGLWLKEQSGEEVPERLYNPSLIAPQFLVDPPDTERSAWPDILYTQSLLSNEDLREDFDSSQIRELADGINTNRERALTTDPKPKDDFFMTFTAGGKNYHTRMNWGVKGSPWNSAEMEAYQVVFAEFVFGGYNYYRNYEEIKQWGMGSEQPTHLITGMYGQEARKETVARFIRGHLANIVDKQIVEEMVSRTLSDLRSGVDEERLSYLGARLGLDTTQPRSQLKRDVKSRLREVRQAAANGELTPDGTGGGGGASMRRSSGLDYGLDIGLGIAGLVFDDGFDVVDIDVENIKQRYPSGATLADVMLATDVRTVASFGKIGVTGLGVLMSSISTYETLGGHADAGDQVQTVVNGVEATRSFVEAMEALEYANKPMWDELLAGSIWAKGIKLAGYFGAIFDFYEFVKNGIFALQEMGRGDGDQAVGYALMSVSALGLTTGGISALGSAAGGSASIPGVGWIVVAGIVLGIAGIAVLAWAKESDLDKVLKHCYFGESQEADLARTDLVQNPSKIGFGFYYPDSGNQNIQMQISMFLTIAQPIGFMYPDGWGWGDYGRATWEKTSNGGTGEINLEAQSAAGGSESKLKQSGYLVVRPLSDVYKSQTISPKTDDYASGIATGNVETYHTKGGAQPPLHLIALDPNNQSGQGGRPATKVPIWQGSPSVQHSISTSGDLASWTSTFNVGNGDPTRVFGFSHSQIADAWGSDQNSPWVEVIHLTIAQTRAMLESGPAEYGAYLDVTPAPREYRRINQG